MRVQVRLGAGLSTLVGRSQLSVEVDEDATVDDLFESIQHSCPPLSDGLTNVLAVVDGTHVSRNRQLERGQEVALLMPAAGG